MAMWIATTAGESIGHVLDFQSELRRRTTAMANALFIKSITPRGLLSFGPETPPLELGPLNVLIGPNASGKSNLTDVFALTRNAPVDLSAGIRKGGGADEWLWKGNFHGTHASLELVLTYPQGNQPLRHLLSFTKENQDLSIETERIENEQAHTGMPKPYFYYEYTNGRAYVNQKGENRGLAQETADSTQSILSQRRDPEYYPEITYLSGLYEQIRIYREWPFGRDAMLRRSQPADQRGDRLEEDYSNLGLVLNQMGTTPAAKNSVVEGLRDLYEAFTNYEVIINSGSVQIFFTERDRSIPATRLSDGTLRYLCLLAILYNPKSPLIVCIEEPELGLHPDIVTRLAKHLRAASQRMQLIVTTHSDILIDALSDTPESIVVFENHDGATRMNRLDRDELSVWLQKYSLGQLWTKGHIGGNRW